MRRYDLALHTKLSQQNRNLHVVCPFPGRNPLRLSWRVYSERFLHDGSISPFQERDYYGKFTMSAWQQFVRTYQEGQNRRIPLYAEWSLFDKARRVLAGYSPRHGEAIRNPNGCQRYFFGSFAFAPGVDPFQHLRPMKAGAYHLFCLDREDPTPQQLVNYGRIIATTIPHVRSI